MPRKTVPLPTWARHLLTVFSPEEISRGGNIPMPRRDPSTKKAFMGSQKISGTRMTSRKIFQLEQGIRQPTKPDLKKLRDMYRRYTYHTLRSSGASSKQANRHKSLNIRDLSKMSSRYEKAAKAIADLRGTSPLSVRAQLKKSSITPENLRKRTIRSGLREWESAMGSKEFEELVDSMMESDFLIELEDEF